MTGASGKDGASRLGGWAWAGLLAVTIVVFYAGATRYLDPVGEKYLQFMPPGGADFVYPFNGARALLAGVDPYTHDIPALIDPWRRDEPVNGVMFRQFYPPSHLALYVPLAWATDGDFRTASRVWFHLNVLFLIGLSLISCCLLAKVMAPPSLQRNLLAALLPVLLFVLGTNQGVSLGLERGQSDIFGAMLCWCGTLLWVRGNRFVPMFLVVTVASIKGYAVLFALGLGLLGLMERKHLVSVVGGALLSILVIVVPVAEHLPRGIEASLHRANMFWNVWYNHSFKNLAFNLSPDFAGHGRLVLSLIALVGISACWWRLRKVYASEANNAEQTIWMVLFCTASLSTMLGASALSVSYNLILILPGALVLMLGQRKLREVAPVGSDTFIGVFMLVTTIALFTLRMYSLRFPVATIGLFGIIILAGWAAVFAKRNAGTECEKVATGDGAMAGLPDAGKK